MLDDTSPGSHRGLNSLLKNVERAETPQDRHGAVRDLASMLRRHFFFEEKEGGFFDMVAKHVPRHRKVVAELRRAHRVMLDDLAYLSEHVEENVELGDVVANRLQGLLRHLRDHEAIERRILQDAIEARTEVDEAPPPPDPTGGNRLSDASALSGDDETGLDALVDPSRLSVVFQPIIDMLTGVTFAHEALVRCDLPDLTPPRLFEGAVEHGCTGLLGRTIREIAMVASGGGRLFLNIHPEELNEGWLIRPDDPVYACPDEIYLEITESAPMTHHDVCKSVLKELASRAGVHLVVDDLGAGYSNLLRIASLEPAVVKLDRQLIAGIHKDKRQRELVTAVVDMCVRLDAQVVAEGIETIDEYFALLDTGVHYAQGFLFARPAYPPPPVVWPPSGA